MLGGGSGLESPGVIMKIGGWKTRSVFERYAIVSQSDIRDAMPRQQLEAGQRRDMQKLLRKKLEKIGLVTSGRVALKSP